MTRKVHVHHSPPHKPNPFPCSPLCVFQSVPLGDSSSLGHMVAVSSPATVLVGHVASSGPFHFSSATKLEAKRLFHPAPPATSKHYFVNRKKKFNARVCLIRGCFKIFLILNSEPSHSNGKGLGTFEGKGKCQFPVARLILELLL